MYKGQNLTAGSYTCSWMKGYFMIGRSLVEALIREKKNQNKHRFTLLRSEAGTQLSLQDGVLRGSL